MLWKPKVYQPVSKQFYIGLGQLCERLWNGLLYTASSFPPHLVFHCLQYEGLRKRVQVDSGFVSFLLTDHPYYVGVQYHPEYLTRPMEPSPPYLGLILAACGKLQNFIARGCQLSPRARYDCISDEEHLDDEVTQAFGRMTTTHHSPGSDTSASSDSWTILIMCTIKTQFLSQSDCILKFLHVLFSHLQF